MKKSKLLTPILTIATLGSMVPVITLATSCNKSSNSQIELDKSTPKAQTTTANKTTAVYAFNLKNQLTQVSNDEEADEIDVEIEDETTQDAVNVEISATKYDPTTGKLYVTITISKEDGSLNDAESINFSLNFHCHKHGSEADKWSQKFTQFIITHSTSIKDLSHLDDTDVTKKIRDINKPTENFATYEFLATDTWAEGTVAEGEYDISKLKCYVLQDQNRRHWLDTITLPKYYDVITPEIVQVSEGIQKIRVKIPYAINEFAHYGDKARFSLLFTYDDDTVFQTIGGCSVNYVRTLEEDHVGLYSSRERHFYKNATLEGESSNNYICLAIEDEKTYSASDFNIAITKYGKDSEAVKLVADSIQILEFTVGEEKIQELVFAYTVDGSKVGIDERELHNIDITVSSTQQDNEWTQTINGFAFQNWGRWDGTLVSHDVEQSLTLSTTATTTLNDYFATISPFDVSDIMSAEMTYTNSSSTEVTKELDIEEFNHFGTKVIVPVLDDAAKGSLTVTFKILVHTLTACYWYELTTTVTVE